MQESSSLSNDWEIRIGSIFGLLLGWLVGRYFYAGDSIDVTLAFEDAKVIPHFFREETYLGHIWDWD